MVLPVDPPRPFLRLDVDIIVIDINLGNLHLKVVGKEPDGFPHRAKAGTPWRLEQRGRSWCSWRKQREKWLHFNKRRSITTASCKMRLND